jgi:hypothetical protein
MEKDFWSVIVITFLTTVVTIAQEIQCRLQGCGLSQLCRDSTTQSASQLLSGSVELFQLSDAVRYNSKSEDTISLYQELSFEILLAAI